MIFPLTVVALLAASLSAAPQITVVYPRAAKGDTIAYIDRVDSNFVFGSVTPAAAQLLVNGSPAHIYGDSTFLAFVPLDWTTKSITLAASINGDTSIVRLHFDTRPKPSAPKSPDYQLPRRVIIAGGAARSAPNGAYYIFPDSGTVSFADIWQDGNLRLPLTPDQSVWIPANRVRDGGSTDPLKPQVVSEADLAVDGEWETIGIPLSRKCLYRIWESTDPDRLFIDLYGVVSHLDRIHYPTELSLIREIIWDQPEDQVLRLEISLNHGLWGYRTQWNGDGLNLMLRRPPVTKGKLHGLKIAVDPGHGGDQDGAIGPAGLKEKDLNLAVAMALAELLRKKGAEVLLTRTTDTTLGLDSRVEMADDSGAQLLISLHHNALPDGANPFDSTLGASTHYYHPQSRLLAQSVQRAVTEALKLPDEGVYYDNLALVRPTAMPAILLEAAYIMLPDQERVMRSPEYPARLAKAVVAGIVEFIKSQ